MHLVERLATPALGGAHDCQREVVRLYRRTKRAYVLEQQRLGCANARWEPACECIAALGILMTAATADVGAARSADGVEETFARSCAG